MVEAGIVRAKSSSGSTVLIGPGKYYETFTVDVPCTLKATEGIVTIGKLDYQASTTLDIITLNTHLAGDQLGMPSWKDKARAYDIAHFFGGSNPRPDVVGFQEIWDEDLFFGGDGAAGILPMSGYPHGKHGWYPCLVMEPVPSGCRGANSGLAVMSKHLLADFAQHSFGVFCSGVDCLANKSWVQATIDKDGFRIGLFVLHTQADSDPLAVEKRKWQIAMLTGAIHTYRESHPDHPVFALGDYNVFGEKTEYNTTLIPLIGNVAGGRDADRNNPGFVIDCEFIDCSGGGCLGQWTVSRCNDLAVHFDDETVSGRLDYIFYFPSRDGSVEVIPAEVRVLPFTGRDLTEDGLTTNESSDHWSVYGQFKLIRR
jgi:endonuclease/exonuclease/phosphatase family metal-dependent hydrolase